MVTVPRPSAVSGRRPGLSSSLRIALLSAALVILLVGAVAGSVLGYLTIGRGL
jgi:hypothetical protein